MNLTLTVLIVIAALALIALVLFQDSKGGGLAAGFASGNQVLGAPKTAEFLEKATWTLAGFIVVLSIFSVGFAVGQSEKQAEEEPEVIEQTVDEAPSQASETPAETK
jgi:preprotein translocase subunit SecG